MQIGFVLYGSLVPCSIDDPHIKHDAAILLETDNVRIALGLINDKDESGKYTPYYSRVLTVEKAIQLRNALSAMIEDKE